MDQQRNERNLSEFLQKRFGFDSFRPGQEKIIRSLLDRKSVLGILPTGKGKSLCYQYVGAFSRQPILIISPLLSLMQDQVDELRNLGFKRVIALTSALDFREKSFVINNLERYDFIFMAPEMLRKSEVIAVLKQSDLKLMVVDEAHCISQWGPDFRPDYLQLGKIRRQLNNLPVLALTATATPQVEQDILEELHMTAGSQVVRASVDRPNIYLDVEKISNKNEKDQKLLEIVKEIQGPGLVYFSSKKTADQVSDYLKEKTGLRVASYHADIDPTDRFVIQQQFLEGRIDLVCATSAFGMGINKKNIRFVIHYHLPADIESCVQEIGRAGRDNKQSIAILLYSLGDEFIQNQLAENGLPAESEIHYYYNLKAKMPILDEDKSRLITTFKEMNFNEENINRFFAQRRNQKRAALNNLLSYINTNGCRRKFISNYFGENREIIHQQDCCGTNSLNKLKALGLLKSDPKPQAKKEKQLLSYDQVLKRIFKVK